MFVLFISLSTMVISFWAILPVAQPSTMLLLKEQKLLLLRVKSRNRIQMILLYFLLILIARWAAVLSLPMKKAQFILIYIIFKYVLFVVFFIEIQERFAALNLSVTLRNSHCKLAILYAWQYWLMFLLYYFQGKRKGTQAIMVIYSTY